MQAFIMPQRFKTNRNLRRHNVCIIRPLAILST